MLPHRTSEWKTKWQQWLLNLKKDTVVRLDPAEENPTKDWFWREAYRLNIRVVVLTDKQTDQLIMIRLN
jgi:hypothetical protein